MHKLTVVTKAFIIVTIVTIALTFGAFYWLHVKFPLPPASDNLRISYLEQYIAVFQLIAVGVVAAFVSVIVPLMLPEARDRFERYKESRKAYSRVKTAVIYLPDKVVSLDRKSAFQLIEETHRELHLAETFMDEIIGKGYLYWYKNPDLWFFYNYWQIFAIAEVCRKYDWESTDQMDDLRVRLHSTLKVVHARFGTRGQHCADLKWNLKDGSRLRGEEKIKAEIKEALR